MEGQSASLYDETLNGGVPGSPGLGTELNDQLKDHSLDTILASFDIPMALAW